MIRLFYIANIRFPTERAHGIQVAHMCSALSEQHGSNTEQEHGTDAERIAVTLLVPDRKTFSDDPFEYYGVERNFSIEKIPVPDIVRFGTVGFFIESLVFAHRVVKRIRVNLRTNPRSSAVLVYTREELPLLFLPRGRVFYEAHQIRRSFFFRFLLRRAAGIIVISHGLKEALVKSGYPRERIMVAPDGYDEKIFSVRIDKNEARKRLGLPKDARIAMYIGGLEAWKGAETLCMAARSLAEANILVAIIGGTEKEVDKLQNMYPLVRFLGARPYRDLAANQQAADILVVPNSGEHEISKLFTSPLKLFAHMASGIAFCAANVPALSEIVTEEHAFIFPAGDSEGLVHVIKKALSSLFLADRLSKAAAAEKRARDFTWDKRAQNVLAYIQWLGEEKYS